MNLGTLESLGYIFRYEPDTKPDRQWRSSSYQESKKVRVSRDLWLWPWLWAHPGCRLTWRPSCVSLVAIRPFAWEKNRFSCQHKSAHIAWLLTLTLQDLEHTLDARWPGVHRVQVWWRSGHLSARRSNLRKSLQTDNRRTDAEPLH